MQHTGLKPFNREVQDKPVIDTYTPSACGYGDIRAPVILRCRAVSGTHGKKGPAQNRRNLEIRQFGVERGI